jgi:hypothetical protein
MSSKFAEFLEKNKLDARRLIAASKRLERLQPEDRATRLARRRAKAGDAAPAAAAGEEKKEAKKPRSGRAVTPRLLEAARAGKSVPGSAKTRLVRAINHLLTQKKQPAVDHRALF